MIMSRKSRVTDLLYLYDRPREPIFMPRDNNGTIFKVPKNYALKIYRFLINYKSRAAGDKRREIDIKDLRDLPKLGIAGKIDRNDNFSIFLPRHRDAAIHLIELLYGFKEYDDFLSACVAYRDHVNPQLFIYCLSVLMLHRPDTQHVLQPPLCQVIPHKFIHSSVFPRVREEAYVVPSGERRSIYVFPPTASDLEPENRLAYFREDIGINLHHWHWHAVYPVGGPIEIVKKDRRGELFFYMHSQIVARYNVERFCNNLRRVKRWNRWQEPIPEGYFPKLHSPLLNHPWPNRPENSVLKDVNRLDNGYEVDIQQLERWRDRIYEIIAKGSYEDSNGEVVRLTEKDGIDVLGNIIEASSLSPNPGFYGNLHNSLHMVLAYLHDPEYKFLEPFGPIGDPTTAMRDPIFYRLHAWVEHVFQMYKKTLPAYTDEQLDYPGISVTGVKMCTKNEEKENELYTLWQENDVDLSRGFDFTPRGPVKIRITHLQHTPYSYQIQVNNTTGSDKLGTCRIFMVPKNNETGKSMGFADQRGMAIELDKFTVNLKPGENEIVRDSTSSSVAIPFNRTFGNWGNQQPTDSENQEIFNFCGCGWPEHMLIPRGTEIGYDVEVFVMISNYDYDKIEQEIGGECTQGSSYCGIRNKKYPDARAMGYPFDRPAPSNVTDFSEFLRPNMKTIAVKIVHKNETLKEESPAIM